MIGTNSATARHPLTWNLNKSLRYISHDGGVYTEGTGLKSDYSYGLKGKLSFTDLMLRMLLRVSTVFLAVSLLAAYVYDSPILLSRHRLCSLSLG